MSQYKKVINILSPTILEMEICKYPLEGTHHFEQSQINIKLVLNLIHFEDLRVLQICIKLVLSQILMK